MITSELEGFELFPVNYDRPKKFLNNPAYHSKYNLWNAATIKKVTAYDKTKPVTTQQRVIFEIEWKK